MRFRIRREDVQLARLISAAMLVVFLGTLALITLRHRIGLPCAADVVEGELRHWYMTQVLKKSDGTFLRLETTNGRRYNRTYHELAKLPNDTRLQVWICDRSVVRISSGSRIISQENQAELDETRLSEIQMTWKATAVCLLFFLLSIFLGRLPQGPAARN